MVTQGKFSRTHLIEELS